MKQKFEQHRKDFYELSGKASDVGRHLAFAGIAVIWIFRQQSGGPIALPEALIRPAFIFVIALALDLLQYVVGAVLWGTFMQMHERRNPPDEEVIESSELWNQPANLLFILKLMAVVTGYWFLYQYLLMVLKPLT